MDDSLASLAKKLKLTRPLVFLDLETTGTATETDRIIEIALAVAHPDGRVMRFERLLNPGCAIPSQASAVHGIVDDDVRQAPSFSAVAGELAQVIANCDFAGFNVLKFDLKMLAAEFSRAGVAVELSSARVVDAMAIFHRNERRDLTAAVAFYLNREHRGHRAVADVDATIDVLLAQLDRYTALPGNVDDLAGYCDGRQPDWLTTDGRIAWRDGAARITFGKHSGKSLETLLKEEPGYLRWILDKDFPQDLKQLVADAFAGRLPSLARGAGENQT